MNTVPWPDLIAFEDGARAPDQALDDRLWQIFDLADELEAWGYAGLWMAEGHGSERVGQSPEMLLPILAGRTEGLRIGAAQVQLSFYSPVKVASDYRLLSALFSARIELAVVSAEGLDREHVERLRDGRTRLTPFEEKVEQLAMLAMETVPKGHDLEEVRATPLHVAAPRIFLFGSSAWAASCAARHGLGYGEWHMPDSREAIAERFAQYREHFRASPAFAEPQAVAAVLGICAATEAEAETLARQSPHARDDDRPIADAARGWRQRLTALAELYRCQSVAWMDACRASADRFESYRLLAQARSK